MTQHLVHATGYRGTKSAIAELVTDIGAEHSIPVDVLMTESDTLEEGVNNLYNKLRAIGPKDITLSAASLGGWLAASLLPFCRQDSELSHVKKIILIQPFLADKVRPFSTEERAWAIEHGAVINGMNIPASLIKSVLDPRYDMQALCSTLHDCGIDADITVIEDTATDAKELASVIGGRYISVESSDSDLLLPPEELEQLLLD